MDDIVRKVKLCGLTFGGELRRDWSDCLEVDALVTETTTSVISRKLAELAGAEVARGARTFRGPLHDGALVALQLEGYKPSHHFVVVDDRLAETAKPPALMILGRDYLQDNRVRIDPESDTADDLSGEVGEEARVDHVVRLKITRTEAKALREFAKRCVLEPASDQAFDDVAEDATVEADPDRTSGDLIDDEEILKLRVRGKYRSNHCFLYFGSRSEEASRDHRDIVAPGPASGARGPGSPGFRTRH
jgi:hypothetical protein